MGTVSYIGLGAMGIEMARRLLDHGHELTVWNRSDSAALDDLISRGAIRVATVAEAMQSPIVFSMLAHDAAVDERFDAETLASAPAGTIHLNMSTISMEAAEMLADRHAVAGVEYVAAPVLGKPNVAAAGMLNIVAAGPVDAIAAASEFLDVMGKQTWNVGEKPATANLVKIAVNYNLIHAIQALAESITLVERGGIAGQQFVDILTDTAFAGSAYTGYGSVIAERRYSPASFRVELGLKDLSLAQRAADGVGAALPSAALLRDLFEQTVADPELSDLDWAAVAEITRRQGTANDER